jgi:hypothetical protein
LLGVHECQSECLRRDSRLRCVFSPSCELRTQSRPISLWGFPKELVHASQRHPRMEQGLGDLRIQVGTRYLWRTSSMALRPLDSSAGYPHEVAPVFPSSSTTGFLHILRHQTLVGPTGLRLAQPEGSLGYVSVSAADPWFVDATARGRRCHMEPLGPV